MVLCDFFYRGNQAEKCGKATKGSGLVFGSWSLTPVVSRTMRRIEGERKLKAAEARFLLFCNCNKCNFGKFRGQASETFGTHACPISFSLLWNCIPDYSATFYYLFLKRVSKQKHLPEDRAEQIQQEVFLLKEELEVPFQQSDIAATWKMCSLKTARMWKSSGRLRWQRSLGRILGFHTSAALSYFIVIVFVLSSGMQWSWFPSLLWKCPLDLFLPWSHH